MNARQSHWEQVYASKAADSVSWYQASADNSLRAIRNSGMEHEAAIVDVGGGASVLVDQLLDAGFSDLTVLDIAASALAIGKTRLGTRAQAVEWIVADILTWKPTRTYHCWHDRAVFHFLTSGEARSAYRAVLDMCLRPGGTLIIATFAPDGPARCSGQTVQRWSPEDLSRELGPQFHLTESMREDHRTPVGAIQSFTWCRFRRV